jgi:hypothetical protein
MKHVTPVTLSHDTLHSTSTALNSYLIHSTACRNILYPTSTRWAAYGARVSGTDVSPRHTEFLPHCCGVLTIHTARFSTSHYFHFLDNSSDVIVPCVTCCSKCHRNQNIFLQPLLGPDLTQKVPPFFSIPSSYILHSRVPTTCNQCSVEIFSTAARNCYCS